MQKTYILDTNVLIQAPYALQSFEDNHLVLPLAVLEELDGLKNAEGERGANARQAIRYLESLRTAGNLLEGVSLPGGGTLRLEVNCVDVKLPEGFPEHKNDNRILKVCIGLRNRETPVILVTKDIMVCPYGIITTNRKSPVESRVLRFSVWFFILFQTEKSY